MKKFRIIILFLIALSFLASAFADGGFELRTSPRKAGQPLPSKPVDEVLEAGGSLGAVVYKNLTSGMGQLKLSGTTVQERLEVDGSLFTQTAILSEVFVRGEATLKNSIITSSFETIGYLKAEGTTFHGPLTLGGIKAAFTSSNIPSIYVLKEESFKGKQIIELKHKTIVNGSITFESGKGEVHCYSGCKVVGPIKGGKLIKKGA